VSEATIQAHGYRLKHFVRWCEDVQSIENLNDLSGRDLQRFTTWRREDGDLNNVTVVTQLSTLRVFLKWCENINAVEEDLHDKILMPNLAKHEDQRDAMLNSSDAKDLLQYLRKFELGTRTHALIEVLWHTGMRIGAAHGLDLGDYDPHEQNIEVQHRPDTETRLKNKQDGERYVGLSEMFATPWTRILNSNEQMWLTILGRVKFGVNCGRRRRLRANFELSQARHC